jgi:hypothetical protein
MTTLQTRRISRLRSLAGLALAGVATLASSGASAGDPGVAVVTAADQRLTETSIEFSLLAHEMREELAKGRMEEFMRQRNMPAVERMRKQLRKVAEGKIAQWKLPDSPRAGSDAVAGDTANASAGAEMGVPGGVYTPRSWGSLDVPYTFDPDMVDAFFFSGAITGENLDPEEFNAANGLPNVITALLILETDLEDIGIKFVGFNPTIHDRAIVFSSTSLDPELVDDYISTGGEPDDLADLPPCLNSANGFGAPSAFDGDDSPLDDTPARELNHCNWTDIGDFTRAIGFALGLSWHQVRFDRDTYVEIFPENVIPIDQTGFPVSIAGTNITQSQIQFRRTLPPTLQTIGEYDAFSVVHQNAFSFSVNGLPTFLPLEPLLQTTAVIEENQRRAALGLPLIPGTNDGATPAEIQAGLDELLTLMGFTVEFSTGDLVTIEELFTSDPVDNWFIGQVAFCPFDVNADLRQDFGDLFDFAALWLNESNSADLDRDGFVEPADLATFFNQFNAGVCDPVQETFQPNGCPYDIDQDGDQDFDDRLVFLAFYDAGNPVADLNGDGLVNIDDLDLFNGDDFNGDNGIFLFGDCELGQTAPRFNGCRFDLDADGDQDFDDRQAFGVLFATGNTAADLNSDGIVDGADQTIFNDGFQSGECDPNNPPDNNCPLDLNGDGRQNFTDLYIFVQLWQAGDPSTDLNGDGLVGIEDIQQFSTLFRPGFCSPIQPDPSPNTRPDSVIRPD